MLSAAIVLNPDKIQKPFSWEVLLGVERTFLAACEQTREWSSKWMAPPGYSIVPKLSELGVAKHLKPSDKTMPQEQLDAHMPEWNLPCADEYNMAIDWKVYDGDFVHGSCAISGLETLDEDWLI